MPKNNSANQSGIASILILIAAVGIVAFLLISNAFNFKDTIFNKLFPKPPSHAAEISPSAPDEVLFKLKLGLDDKSKNNIRKHFGVKKDSEITQIGVEKGKVPAKARDIVIEALRKNPSIEYAEPNYLRKSQLTPNDTFFPNEYALSKINAAAGWDISTGISTAIIAVLDTGIDINHEDLIGKAVGTPPADDNGHGTLVSGVVAAFSNNGKGISGVCWACPILSLKVLNSTGFGDDSTISNGIILAADHGAKVINMSLGGYSDSSTLQDSINYAWNKGVVLVAASGNDGVTTPFYPAADNNVVAVGGTDSSDIRVSSSNYGSWLDVVAPGGGVLTTNWQGSYDLASGTSIATPHVAGLAGLIFSAKPGVTNKQVVDIITSTADDLGDPSFDQFYGWGRINIGKALQKATGVLPQPTVTPTSTPTPTPTPTPTLLPTPTPSPVDTVAPTATITSVTNGQTVSGTTNVVVSATDNVAVSSVSLFVDSNINSICYTTTCNFTLDTTQLSNGSHTLFASVLDTSNNETSTPAITVNVNNVAPTPVPTPIPTPTPVPLDTVSPTVYITNPTNGATVKASSKINITASALDNVTVTKVEFYVGGAIKCTDTTTPYTCLWSVPGGKKGTNYNITAKAYDEANNTSSSNITVKTN